MSAAARQLIYIVGAPGSGKTTLMRAVTDPWTRHSIDTPAGSPRKLPRDLLFNAAGDLVAVELGKRRGTFSGTDALGMTAIEAAVPWLGTMEAQTVLCEGARLANARFLSAAISFGYTVHLLHLSHPRVEEWRAKRAAQLGKEQKASWVKGAATRAANLVANPPAGVETYTGGPSTLYRTIKELMA